MERYTDMIHVTESIDELIEAANDPGQDGHMEGKIIVVDAGMAKVVSETRESLEERNLFGTEIEPIDDNVCYIEWTLPEIGGLLLELSFHESEVNRKLELMPAGNRAIDADQATNPTELGPRLRESLQPLVDEYDAIFTFKGVEAASMSNGGHYTDFEYEYSIDGVESVFG